MQERDGSNLVTREYVWGQNMGGGIGGLLNMRQGGSDYAYLYDGKGNVTALLDPLQAVAGAYAYDPFGRVMKKAGTMNQPYMFSTKEYDSETGLSYYGYRYYNASTGKWITRDPIEEEGGVNLYGFVGNNAGNWVDPLGLWLTKDHNRIILGFAKTHLPSLNSKYISAIQEGSKYVDTFQESKYSYMHHMRDGRKNQSIDDANRRMNQFIKYHLRNYRSYLSKGNYCEAYKELGMALHPVMDSTTPTHKDFQKWDGMIPLLFSGIHGIRELNSINDEQINATIQRMIETLNKW